MRNRAPLPGAGMILQLKILDICPGREDPFSGDSITCVRLSFFCATVP